MNPYAEVLGQVRNRSTKTEVRKPKYGNRSTEVRRKAAVRAFRGFHDSISGFRTQ